MYSYFRFQEFGKLSQPLQVTLITLYCEVIFDNDDHLIHFNTDFEILYSITAYSI